MRLSGATQRGVCLTMKVQCDELRCFSACRTKSEKVDLTKAYELRRAADGKDCINLVVTGEWSLPLCDGVGRCKH